MLRWRYVVKNNIKGAGNTESWKFVESQFL